MERAEGGGSREAIEEAREQRNKFDELKTQFVGLNGRERDGSDPFERARLMLKSRRATAIKRIRERLPGLARHLEQSIKCSVGGYEYRPEPPVEWRTD